jgi:hypothetical protein
MTAVTAAPVSLFYRYAHEDEPLRDGLQGTSRSRLDTPLLSTITASSILAPRRTRAAGHSPPPHSAKPSLLPNCWRWSSRRAARDRGGARALIRGAT